MTANHFISELKTFQSDIELQNVQRYFRDEGLPSKFIGVRMNTIFTLAKRYDSMSFVEVEKLLCSPYYEARMGAVSIMDFQARSKKTAVEHKKKLFDLYLKRLEYINNWDLVDRGAPYIIGGYLFDKSRTILYKLAKSKNVYDRRTAIVSTYYFIRQNDVQDTFNIAQLLIQDTHDLIHKAVGSWIREAGKRDEARLMHFLQIHAASMPRVMLRYAVEKLSKNQKNFFLNLGKTLK